MKPKVAPARSHFYFPTTQKNFDGLRRHQGSNATSYLPHQGTPGPAVFFKRPLQVSIFFLAFQIRIRALLQTLSRVSRYQEPRNHHQSTRNHIRRRLVPPTGSHQATIRVSNAHLPPTILRLAALRCQTCLPHQGTPGPGVFFK